METVRYRNNSLKIEMDVTSWSERDNEDTKSEESPFNMLHLASTSKMIQPPKEINLLSIA